MDAAATRDRGAMQRRAIHTGSPIPTASRPSSLGGPAWPPRTGAWRRMKSWVKLYTDANHDPDDHPQWRQRGIGRRAGARRRDGCSRRTGRAHGRAGYRGLQGLRISCDLPNSKRVASLCRGAAWRGARRRLSCFAATRKRQAPPPSHRRAAKRDRQRGIARRKRSHALDAVTSVYQLSHTLSPLSRASY
jgi:hypothetical protein